VPASYRRRINSNITESIVEKDRDMLAPLAFYQREATPESVEPKASPFIDTSRLDRQFFLEVGFKVRAIERDLFASKSFELVPNFEKLGLCPNHSMWKPDVGPVPVFNYWDLGSDLNRLFDAELALPDLPIFNSFNKIVRDEEKNIAIQIAGKEVVPVGEKLSRNDYRYLRVTSEVSNTDFNEFVARVEAYVKPFSKKLGWMLGKTYYGVTGREGGMSQLWIVPRTEVARVAEALSKAPWFAADPSPRRKRIVKGVPAFDVLEATPTDPLFEPVTNSAPA
jgi:hypothetical protein